MGTGYPYQTQSLREKRSWSCHKTKKQVPDNDPDVQTCSRVAPGSHTKLGKVFWSFSMDIYKGISSTFHDFSSQLMSIELPRSKTTHYSIIVSFAFVCPLCCNYLCCFSFGHELFVPNPSAFSSCNNNSLTTGGAGEFAANI